MPKPTLLNWDNIDTVILDMDGTLLDLHFDNYFWVTYLPQRYAEFHQLAIEHAQTKLEALIGSYEGTLEWYCLDHWSKITAMDIPALKREIQHKILLRPHAEAFLAALKQSRKKVILATNCHRKGLEIKLNISKIDRWLDIIISSHDYQQPKEAQAFWHQLKNQEHFDPKRSVFIDDSVAVLRSAWTFGIEHLVCINQPDSQQPVKKSKEFIDIIDFDEIMPIISA